MDYNAIGFKCGLEIHQQLDTNKLFCSCPSASSEGSPDRTVRRRLRASAGESGKIDVAAAHEQRKGKYFHYHFYRKSSCLVELDEEPPHPMNLDALHVAVQVALMMNMQPVDEVQVMRKIVVDGSNTTGFQRTALIAMDGWIETSKGRVSIPTLCIEEESAQIITRQNSHDIYNLSRLGIPLLEIATGSEIQDPYHAQECAEKIGMILRSTGKVKRGIGSIRQDVNLSIEGAPRVEIKGFQELKSIPKVIEYEVKRYVDALQRKISLLTEVRKVEPDFTTSFLRPMPGADRMYPETDILPMVIDPKGIALPELIDDKIARYMEQYSLNNEMARQAVASNIEIERFSNRYRNIKPLFIVEYFISIPKEIKKRFNLEFDVTPFADEIMEKLDTGAIPKEAVIDILLEYGNGKKPDYSKYKSVSVDEVEAEIRKIIEENKGKSKGALMGMAMAKFRGKIDGSKIAETIDRLLG